MGENSPSQWQPDVEQGMLNCWTACCVCSMSLGNQLFMPPFFFFVVACKG